MLGDAIASKNRVQLLALLKNTEYQYIIDALAQSTYSDYNVTYNNIFWDPTRSTQISQDLLRSHKTLTFVIGGCSHITSAAGGGGGGRQALRYKIWDLGLASKSHYKGKIWAFGTKLGLFWDHFWTFPGLLSRYFHENAKNVRKGQNNALSRHFLFQNISNGQ